MKRLIFFLFLPLALAFCTKSSEGGRYISENDTAFSQDIRDISKKINENPANAELYYNRGNAFYYLNRFKDACIDFQYAIKLDSSNALYHFKFAESLLEQDSADSRSARIHLEKAVELKADFNDAILVLGKYYLARQEYDKSAVLMKKLTDQQEFSDQAFLFLGIGAKEQKDTNAALQYFEKSIELNTRNAEAAMQVALIKLVRNDPKTEDYFNRVIAIDEFRDEAYYGKGLYLQRKGRYKDALSYYEKTLGINAAHILANYNQAVIYNLFEDYGRAEEFCNRVLDLQPNNANAIALRGYTFEKRGNKKAALNDYKAALAIKPEHAMANAGLKLLER